MSLFGRETVLGFYGVTEEDTHCVTAQGTALRIILFSPRSFVLFSTVGSKALLVG